MTKDSARQNCGGPRDLIEAALLLIVFVIGGLLWPSSELVDGE